VVWRLLYSFLGSLMGRGFALIGAAVASVLILTAGLKAAEEFIMATQKVYILRGSVAGIAETLYRCLAPRMLSPIELITVISFGLYMCYWLHTRFAPKHGADDLRQKIEESVRGD
jgi:hypothetical protein